MANTPLLQVALDYISLPPALVMAALVAPEVDILEIGTPLCKAAGLQAIRGIRELCPDKLILADFKTPDVGGIEAAMAFDAGADMVTVIGGAALPTVQQAYNVARERGKEMLMELTGVRDILERAAVWRKIGVDRIVYHREWDAQTAGRMWEEADKTTIRRLIDMGYRVTITGGLTLEYLPFFADLPAAVLICGRSIREQPDPRASARQIRQAIAEIWSGASVSGRSSQAVSSTVERAAKAIRWGISEMGLLLDIDGRDCVGCNAPGRLCRGPRTVIRTPAGVESRQLVQQMAAQLAPELGPAVGATAPHTFYIDLSALPQLNENSVLSLLSALHVALQNMGQKSQLGEALNIAHHILTD